MSNDQKPDRELREMPHSSEDRNARDPSHPEKWPKYHGGVQRVPDPDPTGPEAREREARQDDKAD
jgi:hypothetical protein